MVLLKLPAVTSCGPDGVPSLVLKECALQLAEPLTYLFNQSIQLGYFPETWKTSFISPLHKKGDKCNIKNYRPISKISAIPKSFEAIIYQKLSPLLSKLLVSNQHGFSRNKSTQSNLISFIEYMSPLLDEGCQVDCIYSDYSSAFDKLNINILCSKLEAYGVADVSWFRSYLSNRTQIVKYENSYSMPIKIASGSPQGGHLSGILFNLYINDLPSHIDSHVKNWLFADDYKLATVVRGSDDSARLQCAIDALVSWCENNKMHLNIKKCLVMTFTRKKRPQIYDYFMQGEKLERVVQVKDLGVTMSPDLKFNAHFQLTVNKAFRTLGFLFRYSREFKSPLTLKILYCSLIRSSLEYCSTVWSPRYGVYIDLIESVQKKFLRMLAYKEYGNSSFINYEELMKKFNLQPLEIRRDVTDVIFVLKLLNEKINCPELLSLIQPRNNANYTRNKHPFSTNLCRTNITQNHPINRCMSLCNILSNPPYNINIFEENNIQSIKEKLLKLKFSHHPTGV